MVEMFREEDEALLFTILLFEKKQLWSYVSYASLAGLCVPG